MTTLGEMKETIAAEIFRDDLNDAIAKEITRAIKHYKSRRFWFNERQTTITLTVTDGVSVYGQPPAGLAENLALASAYLPDIIRIDSASIVDQGKVVELRLVDELQIKIMTGDSPSPNMPRYYSFFGGFMTLYPIPDDTYEVYIAGVIRLGEPATDDEANNPWMIDAEELIRARAKRNLFLNWMEDSEAAQRMKALEDEALDNLIRETSSRTMVSRITAHDLS